jgi:hypothetical protein
MHAASCCDSCAWLLPGTCAAAAGRPDMQGMRPHARRTRWREQLFPTQRIGEGARPSVHAHLLVTSLGMAALAQLKSLRLLRSKW